MTPKTAIKVPTVNLTPDDLVEAALPAKLIVEPHPLDVWLHILEQRMLKAATVGPDHLEEYIQSRRRILLETMAELLSVERARIVRIHHALSEKHGTEVQQFSSAVLLAIEKLAVVPLPKE